MRKNKTDSAVFIVFFIIGLVFFVLGIFLCKDVFNSNGKVDTVATITNIYTHRDSDGDTRHDVWVAYNVNGIEYQGKLNTYMATYYEGKQIDIYYYEDNIDRIGTHSGDKLSLMFPGLGLIFVIVGFIGVYSKIKRNSTIKKLQTTGNIIKAKYVETLQNTAYAVNGRHPYNVYCEWTNPLDNKVYKFKSDNLWTNPENMIIENNIETITVYVDSTDYTKYFVDVEEIMKDVVELY